MGNKYICTAGYQVPFIQTRLSPFQIESPSTKLRLPNHPHMKSSFNQQHLNILYTGGSEKFRKIRISRLTFDGTLPFLPRRAVDVNAV